MSKLRVRAVLFFAVSALAVPACQQFDGDGMSREDRMANVVESQKSEVGSQKAGQKPEGGRSAARASA